MPLLLILSLAMSGGATCNRRAQPARHIATISVVTAHSVLAAVQDTEAELVCGRPNAPVVQCIGHDNHVTNLLKLREAFEYDGQVARLVRATPAESPTTREVLDLIARIQELVSNILDGIPASPQKQNLIVQLGGQ